MTTEAVDETLQSRVLERLGGRCVALVGLMGAGKTTVGKRLAQVLSLPFCDTDEEIEGASRMTIPELFEAYGEPEFRALEERVIARIVEGGQLVVSTGGGAFMSAATRQVLSERAIVVWLKADLEILMERVRRRSNRPLLKAADPEAVMRRLMEVRHPVYALADLTIHSRAVRREIIAHDIMERLAARDELGERQA
jgi:shikimate kinase